MVTQGRTHYSKSPVSVPKKSVEHHFGAGKVERYFMTPEEIEKYFKEKYPHLEKQREIRRKKIW